MSRTTLEGSVAWVTGASSGIGEALVKALAARGTSVIATARRADRLELLRASFSDGERLHVLPGDLADLGSLPAMAQRAEAWRGHVDLVVHNAGRSQRSLVKDTAPSVVRDLMDLNFNSPVALTHALLPKMLERRNGHFVVISSVVGHLPTPMRSAYAATKHALHGWFDSLRAELHQTGVDVTIVCPGYVRTEVTLNAASGDGSAFGKMDDNVAKGMPADVFAAKLLPAIERRQREVWIGGPETWAIVMRKIAPGLVARLLPRAMPK